MFVISEYLSRKKKNSDRKVLEKECKLSNIFNYEKAKKLKIILSLEINYIQFHELKIISGYQYRFYCLTDHYKLNNAECFASCSRTSFKS
jgi:hypothetical protein